MNSILPPVEKRAWYYKQEKAKSVRMAHLRNDVLKYLAILLPLMAICLLTADYLGRSDLFQITEIEYRGEFKHIDPNEVDQITKGALEGNFFTVDLVAIQQSIANLPWVEAVYIGRSWPNKIDIEVEEHQATMLWANGGLVVGGGQLIEADVDALVDADQLKALPVLDGKATDIAEMMANYALWQFELNALGVSIEELAYSDSAAWTLHLKTVDGDEFPLLLGASNSRERFERFSRMFNTDENYFKQLQYVDARYPNGLVVKRRSIEESVDPDINQGDTDA